jgi:hypothetical protein
MKLAVIHLSSLMLLSLQITVLLDAMLCTLDILDMDELHSSEIFVLMYQTVRRHIPEDSNPNSDNFMSQRES